MGTPQFAVESLKVLIENNYNIVGVITAPDRMGGRGRNQVIESAVKKYALSQNLKILQPKNLKNEEFQAELKSLNADLQIVVAFRMLPVSVWDMPPLGTYNLHGSLLPAFRGAAPINWAIITGAKKTGVTTFKLKHKIDTGDVAYTSEVEISDSDTAGTLHDKLMYVGSELVLKTVQNIENGSLTLTAQNDVEASHAPKIFHDNCEIDFTKDVFEVYNHVRGLSPYPLAWMTLLGKKLKVIFGNPIPDMHDHETGKVITDYKSFIHITCKGGYLELTDVQHEGKKRMNIKDFLNGMGSKMKTELHQ